MARLAAALEIGAAWLLTVLAGVVLTGALLAQRQSAELTALREDRLQVLLDELRERLEADLALGMELADSTRAQRLLEAALDRQAGLRVLDLVGPDGRTLASTDRAAVGVQFVSRVPAPPPATDRAQQREWRADDGGDRLLAVVLVDASGQSAGQLLALHAPLRDPLGRRFAWIVLATTLVVAVAGLALIWWLSAPLPPRASWVEAEGRLSMIEERIGRLMEQVRREEEG
jgi:hypothetical protein